LQFVDGFKEFVGGADLCGHLDAGVGQQTRESFAEDGGVVGEGYTHGISACRCVPRPCRAAGRSRSQLSRARTYVRARRRRLSCPGQGGFAGLA
jgi:hypothetical protein